MPGTVTTSRIDYLQRCGPLQVPDGGSRTAGRPETRRLLHVGGIGRVHKQAARGTGMTSPTGANGHGSRWRPLTADLITGLYGYRIPLSFYLVGSTDGLRVQLGTWSAQAASAPVQERRCKVMESVLRGLYPSVDLAPVADEQWSWPQGGLALGVPAPSGVDGDGSAPIDRIVRAMTGTDWALLVLAYPVSEEHLARTRDSLINERRAVTTAAENEGAPSPLTDQYVELLDRQLRSVGESFTTGGWRTAAYLLGDDESYPRLAGVWRAVMSGDESLPEPVRVFGLPTVDGLAQAWAMPDVEGAPSDGFYRRPFELQTVLPSAQLAAYVHLPELESPGFAVTRAPRFDSMPATTDDGGGVVVGEVLHNRVGTGSLYRVPLASLTRHVFVAGVTGAGKTNTIFNLLGDAHAAGVPFLVIEPAKTEYRALLNHPEIGSELRIFTPGRSHVAPPLFNPFEVPPGITVGEHIDLVRAAFAAAFGMWTPLPQILERCIQEVYVDRGWNLRTNRNARLAEGDDEHDAFPTLGDLVAKVHEVVPTLGYEDRVTGDLRAALVTRLESLRTGAKGAMLDVARGLPIEAFLSGPTVFELEGMGDEGDKAFLTGMLLIRLAEHRRAAGQTKELVHLLVVEEAHRLLANVALVAEEGTANPKGQAVETFSNMLSEVRAYGQGVIIADQVPVRLAPDVMKNSNLKLAHRVVASDDRGALAGAMAMDEAQAMALTSLAPGEAVTFGTGDDAPFLVRVPLLKDDLGERLPTDAEVAKHMATWRRSAAVDALFQPRSFCSETCPGAADACEAARAMTTDEYVQRSLNRLVLSSVSQLEGFDRLWPDLVGVVQARRPPLVDERALLRAFAGHGADWFAGRRGAQGSWPFARTNELRDALRIVLLDLVDGRRGQAVKKRRIDLQQLFLRLNARTHAPYPACEHVCRDNKPQCLFRSAVADLVSSKRYQESWLQADEKDMASEGGTRSHTWQVCQDAAFELVEFPEQGQPAKVNDPLLRSAKRVCLCFEQQMLATDVRKLPRTGRRIIAKVLDEAGL